MKKTAAFLLVLAMMLSLCVAAAAQSIVPELPCDLHLSYRDDTEAVIPDLAVSLYRAAQFDSDGEAELTPEFSGYGLDVQELSDNPDAALRLAEYVQRDALTPTYTDRTDADGKLDFEGISTGIYLVVSDSISDGRTVLKTQPLLLSLPMIDDRSGVYAYDVTATPKPERTRVERDMHVVVIWRDKGFSGRPEKVTVELYRDGELFDTQQVGADTGWRYTWSYVDDTALTRGSEYTDADNYTDATGEPKDHLLSGEHSWYVVERGADGYTVTYAVRPSYNTFVIINTRTVPQIPDLPQTGQLWWPVPILASAGVVLFFCGRRRTEHAHHE